MPVNWIGQVAIRVLSRRSRGDFQPIDAQIHELVDLIPSPCVVFDLAPFSWPGEGGSLLWGTPPHPPARTSPLQPFPDFPRSDVLACGRPSLVRYYAHAEQAPLNLNTYNMISAPPLRWPQPGVQANDGDAEITNRYGLAAVG